MLNFKDCVFINAEHVGRPAELLEIAYQALIDSDKEMPPERQEWRIQVLRIQEFNMRRYEEQKLTPG